MTRLAPWAGWIGGLLGWVISDQLGSNIVQLDCTLADPGPMLLIGLGGAALAVLGGIMSFSMWRRLSGKLDQPGAGTRRFIAATAALASAIFLLAIIFQTISSLIIPQCHA